MALQPDRLWKLVRKLHLQAPKDGHGAHISRGLAIGRIAAKSALDWAVTGSNIVTYHLVTEDRRRRPSSPISAPRAKARLTSQGHSRLLIIYARCKSVRKCSR